MRLARKLYWRVLAAVYAFGAAVHVGNMLGYGEQPWSEAPLSWKLGDLFYAPVAPNARDIRVEATDRFGRVYSAVLPAR